MLLLLMDYTYL